MYMYTYVYMHVLAHNNGKSFGKILIAIILYYGNVCDLNIFVYTFNFYPACVSFCN